MSRISSAFALLLFICSSVSAGYVSPEQAIRVGENFITERVALGDEYRRVDAPKCRPLQRDGRLVGYFLPLHPRGHVIVNPLLELSPVTAYSFESDFEPERTEGYTDLVLDILSTVLDALEENFGDPERLPEHPWFANNKRDWSALLAGVRNVREDVTVGPLITANWDQREPFNNDCPSGGGETCVVGCTATSAVLILSYWRYPEYGEGSHFYNWGGSTGCGGSAPGCTLYASYADAYDWDNILDSYEGDYTEAEAAAVAELNYEMAVAFDMDFGFCSSGAWITDGVDVYSRYFRFADTVEIDKRHRYDAAGWFDRIRFELDAVPPRPMHYGITGHSILIDGYRLLNDVPYYHANYGWGGVATGWFNLDLLPMTHPQHDYLVEYMLAGIEPRGYFPVTEPAGGTVLEHDSPLPAIRWSGAPGDSVKLVLCDGVEPVADLTDWIVNDGVAHLSGTVQASWGHGENYRIKIITRTAPIFGGTDPLNIFVAGAWSNMAIDGLAKVENGQGAAWGDYDGDGLADLYVANTNAANQLFRNLGDNTFEEVFGAPLDIHARSRGAAWADIDNDGDLDLYLTCVAGDANHLFRNDGVGFTDVTEGLLGDRSYSFDPTWTDFDGDGFVDLYFTNSYAADRLLRNGGDGVFEDATVPPLGDPNLCRSANWCDYDADGRPDLFLARSGSGVLYRNTGSGFAIVSTMIPLLNRDAFGGVWGDFDNDGDFDLYLGVNGENRLLRNDGEGAFTDVSTPILREAGECHSVSCGDYDNDGLLDIYVVNFGENQLLHNEGDGVFSNMTSYHFGDSNSGKAAAWADMDNDGDLDLYLVSSDGSNRLLRNDLQNGNHWLHLDLTGATSNRSAIGARITLWAGGIMQTRQVGGDAGCMSQNSLRVEFGLGSTTAIDSVAILWPGGGEQIILTPDVDQVLEIVQDSATHAPAGGSPRFHLAANYPNPFNPVTEIRFGLAEPGAVFLTIHDLRGALVRTLAAGAILPDGEHSRIWNGRDENGCAAPSGVYLCRLRSGDLSESRKLTLLK